VVAVGLAVLCGLPVIAGALPVSVPALTVSQLRGPSRVGVLDSGRLVLQAATVIQPYLPTRYWLAWIDFFRQPVFWRDIQRGFGIQAVYVMVFLAAAWANFSTKDITA
jgi:ABC-2 type transport system permease protein